MATRVLNPPPFTPRYKPPNDSIWQLAVHMYDFCCLSRRQRINLRNRTERLR